MTSPPRWRRRSRRAISDEYDLQALRPDRRRHRRLSGRSSAQVAAALHHLRVGGRRQVDPDRPVAVRQQDDLRGPDGGPRSRLQAGRHPGRRDRLRPAGRRPGRRARARHHHRRRLPLLRHRQAQVHRRRHARPRAVHPQHGHRRLDRRRGRDPDRRPQGRADPDPPPQLSGQPAGHPPRGAGGEQDGPGRLGPGGVRPHRRRLSRLRRSDRPVGVHAHPDLGPGRRQHGQQERGDALVRRSDPDGLAGNRPGRG
jgi:hypothetical protein